MVIQQVMKVLLRHHGLKLAGAKANLYTALGEYDLRRLGKADDLHRLR
jgi:hypothetical protein